MWKHRNSNTNKLYHHGIKGQKWGVRNGPPYPIEDKVLRKGTRLNSVSTYNNSSEYKNRNRWMYLYNPNDEWDSKVYKGPFALSKIEDGAKHVYEHQFEVVKDLKMPTRKERFDEFVNLYKNSRLIAIFDLLRERNFLKTFRIGNEDVYKANVWNPKTTEDFKRVYEILNHAMENVENFKTAKSYAEIMSTKWGAMIDDNNQGVYNKTNNPIIVFRANETLREIGEARIIDLMEVNSNFEDVSRELEKYGEKVMR